MDDYVKFSRRIPSYVHKYDKKRPLRELKINRNNDSTLDKMSYSLSSSGHNEIQKRSFATNLSDERPPQAVKPVSKQIAQRSKPFRKADIPSIKNVNYAYRRSRKIRNIQRYW